MGNHHFIGKSTVSMAIFNSYVKLPEDKSHQYPHCCWLNHVKPLLTTTNSLWIPMKNLYEIPRSPPRRIPPVAFWRRCQVFGFTKQVVLAGGVLAGTDLGWAVRSRRCIPLLYIYIYMHTCIIRYIYICISDYIIPYTRWTHAHTYVYHIYSYICYVNTWCSAVWQLCAARRTGQGAAESWRFLVRKPGEVGHSPKPRPWM